jgi:hypothetical protein
VCLSLSLSHVGAMYFSPSFFALLLITDFEIFSFVVEDTVHFPDTWKRKELSTGGLNPARQATSTPAPAYTSIPARQQTRMPKLPLPLPANSDAATTAAQLSRRGRTVHPKRPSAPTPPSACLFGTHPCTARI